MGKCEEGGMVAKCFCQIGLGVLAVSPVTGLVVSPYMILSLCDETTWPQTTETVGCWFLRHLVQITLHCQVSNWVTCCLWVTASTFILNVNISVFLTSSHFVLGYVSAEVELNLHMFHLLHLSVTLSVHLFVDSFLFVLQDIKWSIYGAINQNITNVSNILYFISWKGFLPH